MFKYTDLTLTKCKIIGEFMPVSYKSLYYSTTENKWEAWAINLRVNKQAKINEKCKLSTTVLLNKQK